LLLTIYRQPRPNFGHPLHLQFPRFSRQHRHQIPRSRSILLPRIRPGFTLGFHDPARAENQRCFPSLNADSNGRRLVYAAHRAPMSPEPEILGRLSVLSSGGSRKPAQEESSSDEMKQEICCRLRHRDIIRCRVFFWICHRSLRLNDFAPRPGSLSPVSRGTVEVQHEGGPGEQKGDGNRTCTGLGIRRRNPQLRVGDFDWRCGRRGVCRLRKAERSIRFTRGMRRTGVA
jgi:hypothetical protein